MSYTLLKRGILGAFLASIFILIFLFFTNSGLHLLVSGIIRWIFPELEIASIKGSINDFTIKQFHYQVNGITINIDELHLALDLTCLRESKLCFQDFTLHDIDIAVKTSTLSKEPLKRAYLSIPFYSFVLPRLMLTNVKVKVNNIHIKLDKLYSGFHLSNNQLVVMPTRITNLFLKLPTLEKVGITNSTYMSYIKKIQKKVNTLIKNTSVEKLNTSIYQQLQLTEVLHSLFAKSFLSPLPSFILNFKFNIDDIEIENLCLSSNANFLISRLKLKGSVCETRTELILLEIDWSKGFLSAHGNFEFKGLWPISITIDILLDRNQLLKKEKIKLKMYGFLHDKLYSSFSFSGPFVAQLELKTQLVQTKWPFTLILTVKNQPLQLDLIDPPQYQLNEFFLRLEGNTQNYRIKLNAVLDGKNLPSTSVSIDANGDSNRFTLSCLRFTVSQGSIELRAVVDWRHIISWNSELFFNKINIASQWPNWTSKLNGKIISRCSWYRNKWQIETFELDLHGHTGKNFLFLKGSLNRNTLGQWNLPKLLLSIGDNNLILKGKFKDSFFLDADFDAPTLNDIFPGLISRAFGHIKLRGSIYSPQFLMNLSTYEFRWKELITRQMELQTNHSLKKDRQRSKIQLSLEKLPEKFPSVTQLSLNLTGDLEKHNLTLVLQDNLVAVHLKLNGSLNQQRQRWNGSLSETYINTPVGIWYLAHEFNLYYQILTKNLIIEPHCWQNPNGQICILKNSEIGKFGKGHFLVKLFNISILNSLFPIEIEASGSITIFSDIIWNKSNSITGKIAVTGRNIKINQVIQGKILPVILETFTLNIELNKKFSGLDWFIKVNKKGNFNGFVQVTKFKNRKLLSGYIHINNIPLIILKPLILLEESIHLLVEDSIHGVVNARLQIRGDLHHPILHGQLKLDHVVIKNNFLPFVITDSCLSFSFTGTYASLQGFIKTKHGDLDLVGHGNWDQMEKWYVHITAGGNRIRIIMPSVALLDISPNIEFKATPKLFSINGKVDIPWARIEVKDIMPQGLFKISKDEVLLDEKLWPIVENNPIIPVVSNLLIHIGDDVHFNAFGLKSKLNGNLKIMQGKQRLELNGQIELSSGRFYAYGQDLIIEKGQLLFSGPIDRPYVNIKAIRNPDSTEDGIQVGVSITGSIDQPKVDFFSNPIKSRQEALFYFFHGQDPNFSITNSTMLASTLIGIGIAQSDKLFSKIGKIFGVNELTLGTQGTGNNSQVIVSGYITPEFQIKYGIGIFDTMRTLTLRYRLMSRLYLEAVSGFTQGLDLLYRFEF